MKKIKVYWAPFIDNPDKNMNLIYEDPQSLHYTLNKKRDKKTQREASMFACPVVNQSYQNIFVFKNPIKSFYQFKIMQNNKLTFMPTENSLDINTFVKPSIENNITFEYPLKWIFFCEESLDMVTSAPYFSEAEHLTYGAMVPGKLDISKWFRVINIQFNLWDDVTQFRINKNEPLFYTNFVTDNQVELIRFEMNDYLVKHARTIASSGEWEPRVSLLERFERFRLSRTRDLILREIKKQVLPD
jgi:hypothetical protein